MGLQLPSIIFAYIDPVSGMILLQLVIGGCLGCTAYFHRKIGGFFRQLLNSPNKLRIDVASTVVPGERIPFVREEPESRPSYRKAA